MRIREHIIFVLLFAAAVCLVFSRVLFLKDAFLEADYLQQLYPWSGLYAQSIKAFHLPLWIRGVQCGFPLFAEGQIGQLYPLNILMFLALPFRAAYNYSFLFHFILSGIFTYFLARRKGADLWGGAISAVLICFGSAYAGCFIHLASLRCLMWFPLVLLVYDIYLEKGKRTPLVLLIGLIAGMQLLSGSTQMAVYSLFFYFLYFLHRSIQKKYSFVSFLKDTAIVLGVAALIALPQMSETLVMTRYSNRESLMTLDFALWNSFSPPALSGTIMPYIGKLFSKYNVIYIGTIGLFFAMVSFWRAKYDRPLRPFILMLAAALFLALGKYNPLYVILLDLFKFYTFRAPARFIYFGVFALSVLAGPGFTYFVRHKERVPELVYRFFAAVLLSAIVCFIAAKAALVFYGPRVLEIAKEYVARNIYGKPFHRYDLDTYMRRTGQFYDSVRNVLSLRNPYVVATILTVLLALVFLYVLKRARRVNLFLKYGCVAFICAELFIFSLFGKGIRPELAGFDTVEPKQKKIFETIKGDKDLFRICPFGRFVDTPLWLRPSMNVLYGIDSIAIYSPLVNRDYFMAMKGLGTVDDSVGIFPPEEEVLYKKLDLLRKMNVKYIPSTIELKDRDLDLIMREDGIYLYRLKGYLPRFRFSRDRNSASMAKADILVNKYGSGIAELEVENAEDGFLVFAEKFYLEWEAYIDGKKTRIYRSSDILQAVKLPPGRHKVLFRYKPWYLDALGTLSLSVFILVLILMFVTSRPGRKKYEVR